MIDDVTGVEALVEKQRESGIEYAYKNAYYYEKKRIRSLELKAQGMPVTLISDTIKGDEMVNAALLEKDIAEANYKADQDLVNARKLNVRVANGVAQSEYYM